MKVTTFYFNNLDLLEVKPLLTPNQHLTAFDDFIRPGDQAEGKYFLFELKTFWGKERIGDSCHARVTLHDVLEECLYKQSKVHGLLYGTFCEAVEEHLLKELRYRTTWTKKNHRYTTVWLVVHRMRANPYVWSDKDYNPLMVVLDPIHPSQCEMWLMVEKGCRGDKETREEALALYEQMTDPDVYQRKPKYIYRRSKICYWKDGTVPWQASGLPALRPAPDQTPQPPVSRAGTSGVLNLEWSSSSQSSAVCLRAAAQAQDQDSGLSTSWSIAPPRLDTNSRQTSSSKKRKFFTREESFRVKREKYRHEPLERSSSTSTDGVGHDFSPPPSPVTSRHARERRRKRRRHSDALSDSRDRRGRRGGRRRSCCVNGGSGQGWGSGGPSTVHLLVLFCIALFLSLVCFFFFVVGAAAALLISKLNVGVHSCSY